MKKSNSYRIIKRNISLCLVIVWLIAMLPRITLGANAATSDSGKCGKNLTWSLDESNGVMTISGTGDMNNYEDERDTPWHEEYVTEIVIEEGVTTIGNNAFNSCRDLTKISIPDTVIRIGEYAFYFCDNLAEVKIHNGVNFIGECAFGGCLGNIIVESGNPYFCSDDGVLFNKDKTILIRCPGQKAWIYSIPDGVTTIDKAAFDKCVSLTKIIIPDSVTTIKDAAFFMCWNLLEINLPDSVKAIGETAFYKCNSLRGIVLPDTITVINDYMFVDCVSLASISIPANVRSIGKSAVSGCENLNEIYFGGTETAWGSIDIEEKNEPLLNATFHFGKQAPRVAEIRDTDIFESGSCGEGVTWELNHKGILTISGTGAMYNGDYESIIACSNPAVFEVVIKDGVTSVGDYAFYKLNAISQISISESVTTIGNSAFEECTSLSEINIPETTTTIGDRAFSNCNSLKSIHIPLGVERIGASALAAPSLEEITVDNHNTNYYVEANGVLFNTDATELVRVPVDIQGDYTVPNGVEMISHGAFLSCTNLTEIHIPESVLVIGAWAFNNCISLKSISIPSGVEGIYFGAFAGCSKLTDVIIPSSVTTLHDLAFIYCDQLTTIAFMGDAPSMLNQASMCFVGVTATVYYPKENETWTSDVMQDYGGNLTWVAADLPNYDGFWLDKDGWTFANAAQSFAEEPASHADDYFIPRERYDEVFGSAYVDATDGLYTEDWGGNCAGMSATAILFFLDSLDWESIDAEYTEDFSNPNDFYRTVNLHNQSQSYYPAIGNDTEVTRLIEAYQLYINAINRSRLVENLENTYFEAEPEIGTLQGVTAENEPIVTRNYTYQHIPASKGGTYIASMLEEFHEAYDENKPLLIALHGDDFGHGVVARTDLKPEDMGDGWWRIYVYDPNKPYINESVTSTVSGVETEPKYTFGCNTLVDNGGDIYLELNPSLNQWRYCTSVNSNSADSYIGSTESGELLWNGVYAKNENNEQYHILRPDFFYTIDLTDFTMEDYANPYFDSTSAWVPENELAVAVDGDTDCTIYDSDGELAAIVEAGDAFVLTATGGFSSYIGQSEDAGSLGGRLYLPVDVYTVRYFSGNVQFFGNSNVISFSCEGTAELTVDITLNSLQIISKEDGIAAVKCANVTSTDECSFVETEGALVAGETFTIAYSDENKVKASTDSKDGEFQLYQKDTNQEEASATKVIKSNSLWWRWIVGGVVLTSVGVLIILLKQKKNS